MSTDDRARAITADPAFQGAVLRAMRRDLTGLVQMDDEHLLVAVRQVSVLAAFRVVLALPCTLAGFTFWADSEAVTFARTDPSTARLQIGATAAQMIAVDGTALLRRDHGPATNTLWADLLAAVPASSRRRLAMLIAAQFTAAPNPVTTDLEDHHA